MMPCSLDHRAVGSAVEERCKLTQQFAGRFLLFGAVAQTLRSPTFDCTLGGPFGAPFPA